MKSDDAMASQIKQKALNLPKRENVSFRQQYWPQTHDPSFTEPHKQSSSAMTVHRDILRSPPHPQRVSRKLGNAFRSARESSRLFAHKNTVYSTFSASIDAPLSLPGPIPGKRPHRAFLPLKKQAPSPSSPPGYLFPALVFNPPFVQLMLPPFFSPFVPFGPLLHHTQHTLHTAQFTTMHRTTPSRSPTSHIPLPSAP